MLAAISHHVGQTQAATKSKNDTLPAVCLSVWRAVRYFILHFLQLKKKDVGASNHFHFIKTLGLPSRGLCLASDQSRVWYWALLHKCKPYFIIIIIHNFCDQGKKRGFFTGMSQMHMILIFENPFTTFVNMNTAIMHTDISAFSEGAPSGCTVCSLQLCWWPM